MKQRTFTALLLALCLAAGTFVSCGSGTEAPVDSVSPTETTAKENKTGEYAPPELPAVDYGGYEFRILTRIEGWMIYNQEHIVLEEENGEVLNDAIYQRNRAVEEQLGVKFVEIVTKDKVDQVIQKSVTAGDDDFDVALPPSAPMYGTDYLVDFYTLDHLSFDKPWWNRQYAEAMSVNGCLVTAVSSMMITQMDGVKAMLFNKKLAEDYALPDLYELVRSGEWTFPKFWEVSKNVTVDLDGSSTWDDSDRYAFVGQDGMLNLKCGVDLAGVTKDADDMPVLNIKNERFIDCLTGLAADAVKYEREIYDPRHDPIRGDDGDSSIFRLFSNDQTLFYVHGFGAIQMYRDMKADFGVIPPPKFDAQQKDYFVEPGGSKCLAIPSTAKNTERTAIVLEAMAYQGYTMVRPKYYESMIKAKYLRDEESVEMLDEYIFTNIGFTPYSGSSLLTNLYKTMLAENGAVASTLASNESQLKEALDKYVALFTK